MKKKSLTKPLNYFKWSIQDENNYQRLFRETTTKWYESKHRIVTSDEIKLINDLPIVDCPYCNKAKYIKYGKNYNGITKYKCKECDKIFTPLTGTLFDSKKIPISEWIEFIIHLFEFHSLKTSSGVVKKVGLCKINYWKNLLWVRRLYIPETVFWIDYGFSQMRIAEYMYFQSSEMGFLLFDTYTLWSGSYLNRLLIYPELCILSNPENNIFPYTKIGISSNKTWNPGNVTYNDWNWKTNWADKYKANPNSDEINNLKNQFKNFVYFTN